MGFLGLIICTNRVIVLFSQGLDLLIRYRTKRGHLGKFWDWH